MVHLKKLGSPDFGGSLLQLTEVYAGKVSSYRKKGMSGSGPNKGMLMPIPKRGMLIPL